MKMHCLKIDPEYLTALADGTKTCEIRKNDRNYQVGDEIILQPWRVNRWLQGTRLAFKITHITHYEMKQGYVALSIKRIPITAEHNDAFGKFLVARAMSGGQAPKDTLGEELNSMTLTHYVLKRADIAKLSPESLDKFHEILGEIGDIRVNLGKEPTPRYLVINHDEEYIGQAINFFKSIGAWGDKEE